MTRPERFAELIKEEISEILKGKVSDPRIGFVSITEVEISPDLKDAKIYVSVFGEEKQKKEAMNGLGSATGFIRAKLACLLPTKNVPQIEFVQDDSIERGSRVLEIISGWGHEKETVRKNKKSSKKR